MTPEQESVIGILIFHYNMGVRVPDSVAMSAAQLGVAVITDQNGQQVMDLFPEFNSIWEQMQFDCKVADLENQLEIGLIKPATET